MVRSLASRVLFVEGSDDKHVIGHLLMRRGLARFPEKDSKKALVHAWLAWREEPGRPYGVAIKSRYLRDDSDAAERFVAWFGRVFGLTGELRQRS